MAHVEVYGARLTGTRTHAFASDGASHDIARGEFEQWMIALHEALLLVVAQPRSFAAQGFAQQEARHAGQTEGGGVELIELHVSDGGAGPPCHGDAVASGHGRIGGVAVDLARAAAGQQDGACADGLTFALLQ